jgi:two-component system, NarL family, response regulator NreC
VSDPHSVTTADYPVLEPAALGVAAGAPLGRAGRQVLLIDEPGISRDGLCALLQTEGHMEVVAIAATSREAFQTLARAQPHVVVMDFSATLQTSPETVRELKRRWPRVGVLVLTTRRDEQFIEAALRAGADAYVLRTDTHTELFNALECLARGKGYVSPAALGEMVDAYKATANRNGGRIRRRGALTMREQEVIALVAGGYRTREMAQLLSLSHKTVEKHRTNLMRKLGLRSAAAVAAYAITHGFV